ncbi:MAG TPA: hypothetical protein VJT09_02175 [Pyrinomonadaceae bacterium]|nr:hypothetical protein [Pyrinomonadaceae bacterium]
MNPRQQKPTPPHQTAKLSPLKRQPVAPPVYQPQPAPRVLQQKRHAAQPTGSGQAIRAHVVQPVRHPPHTPAVSRAKPHPVQLQASNIHRPRIVAAATPRIVQRKPVQPFRSGIIQATKFYPNLHPGAAVPVERSNIFMLDSFANQYRLRRVGTHSVNVPNMKYNFVRTREGEMLLHNRYRHPSLADGQQVLYAGEVFFNNGNLEWWSNGSGHYQPDADGAEQANLPMDYFFSYQQVIKGEHTRRKGRGQYELDK